jgi:hypothetical protein
MIRNLLICALGFAGFGQAAILVEDNFNSLGTGVLGGSAPSTNNTGISGLVWLAPTPTSHPLFLNPMVGNGSGGLAVYTTTQTVGFDLGMNYFVSNPGVYRISVDITHPAVLPDTPNSWVGFGFAQGNPEGLLPLTQNPTNDLVNGGPWAFYRGGGSLNARDLANTGGSTPANGLLAGVTRRFSIEFDTTATQWSYKVLLDGVQQGDTRTYASEKNPESLRYITLSAGISGGRFTSTVDNFTFEMIPEPSFAVMLVVSGGGIIFRRRR